jgi:hypothetical protein
MLDYGGGKANKKAEINIPPEKEPKRGLFLVIIMINSCKKRLKVEKCALP